MIIHSFTPTGRQVKRSFELTPHQQMLLMPVGDVHAWSTGWPAQRFRDHILWGIERGAYFLGMGEYVDHTSKSQRFILSQLRESERRREQEKSEEDVRKLYELIKESKGRWIGLLEGHHYAQYIDGTTSDQYLCKLLCAPFLGTSALIDIRLQATGRVSIHGRSAGATVTVFAHHGSGGSSRTAGGGLAAVERLLQWVEADIYLMGHVHTKVSAPVDRLYRTDTGYLYHRSKIIARTGGFMRAYVGMRPQSPSLSAANSRGSYVEQAALAPSALGGLVISLGLKRITHREAGQTRVDFTVPDIHYSV